MKQLNSERTNYPVSESERANTQACPEKDISFDELIDLYYHEIYCYLLYLLRNRGRPNIVFDAQDLVQEVFLTAWRCFEQLETDRNIRAWLYRVAKYRVWKYFDKCRTRDRYARFIDFGNEERYVELAHRGVSPEQQTFLNEAFKIIREEIPKLPRKQRLAVELRYTRSLDYVDIAEAIDCSYDSAIMNVTRGSWRLRQAVLGKYD